MHLPKSEGGNFELTPAGTFPGRCYRFIDLGSHDQEFQGESKGLKRLVMVGFELPTELMADGRPFSIHKRYTWSTHEKANMRKDLEAWRGAKFTEADFGPGGFDVRNLLGVPCTLTIVHSERDNNTYANLAGIGKAMKGMHTPDPVNAPVYFTLDPDGFDQAVFDTLSDKLKDFIRATPEYRRLTNGNEYGKQKGAEERDPARDEKLEKGGHDERNPPPPNFYEDDIPFNMEWRG
jgi:hypothetical protein